VSRFAPEPSRSGCASSARRRSLGNVAKSKGAGRLRLCFYLVDAAIASIPFRVRVGMSGARVVPIGDVDAAVGVRASRRWVLNQVSLARQEFAAVQANGTLEPA